MAYPVPFATADEVVRIAVEAEGLGYHEVSGNDHLSTQRFVREAWPQPPDYFEPLMMLATIAATTSVVRLGTGILVLPMRDPVLLAKQVATLDQISGGRVTLAVGGIPRRIRKRGARSRRRVADRPDVRGHRVAACAVRATPIHLRRQISAVRRCRVVSEKPVQTPLPIFSGGNGKGALQRAGERCEGWLPAKIGPADIAAGRAKVSTYARAAGRDPADITIGLQSVVCIADTTQEARDRVERSTFDLFRKSLKDTMMKGVDLDKYLADNLIGTPDEVCAKVAAFEEAGLDGFFATLFVANTVDEMLEQMRLFARYVLPAFPDMS